jgi:hypothetical protein
MSSDDDKFWNELAGKLRKTKGLGPLTPEEAEAAFDDAPPALSSMDQIDSIVEMVTSGELTSWEPVSDCDWEDDAAIAEIGEQTRSMFRNQGEEDPDSERAEKELEDQLLSDDESAEDETGLAN